MRRWLSEYTAMYHWYSEVSSSGHLPCQQLVRAKVCASLGMARSLATDRIILSPGSVVMEIASCRKNTVQETSASLRRKICFFV